LQIYDRYWTDAEIASGSTMIRSLHSEPTLFRLSAQRVDIAAHAGPISLKSTGRGESSYRFGRRSVSVSPGQILLVPPSASYTTHVGDAGAEITTLYFPKRLVADAHAVLASPADRLLDGHQTDPNRLPQFPPHRRVASARMSAILRALSCAHGSDDVGDLVMAALAATTALALEAARSTVNIPAARPSVRRELFRRACLVRDLIEQSPDRNLSLAELADAACLSPFHLHRVFKAAFGETPAQMRRRRRVERAKAMLALGDRTVAEVARRAGFDSDSAFSRSFRAATGLTPTAFRHAAGG